MQHIWPIADVVVTKRHQRLNKSLIFFTLTTSGISENLFTRKLCHAICLRNFKQSCVISMRLLLFVINARKLRSVFGHKIVMHHPIMETNKKSYQEVTYCTTCISAISDEWPDKYQPNLITIYHTLQTHSHHCAIVSSVSICALFFKPFQNSQ